MSKAAMSVLLGVWALMAGAGDLPPPKKEAQATQKNQNAPSSGVGKNLIFTEKSRNSAPQASKKPPAPLLILDEKNLGLGCAQPS
jgi:hypothetical protein